jgi:hypothetical protein
MVKLKACKNACIKAMSATSSYGENIENADSYHYNTSKHKVEFFLTKGEWCCSLSFYPKSLILGKLGFYFTSNVSHLVNLLVLCYYNN